MVAAVPLETLEPEKLHFFQPSAPRQMCGKVHLLRPADIAVMKIIAISQRGRKRDFVDLYWYGNNREPLSDVISRVPKQYPEQKHNMVHFLKSLTYFDDAEADPMPTLFFDVSWPSIKKFFRHEVPKVAKQLLEIQ